MPYLSVIIPTFNEAATIVDTLRRLQNSSEVEVIVVDGGSSDRTVELAQSAGVKVLISEAGRAIQMNRGAAAAKGEILLFLHADTTLPPGYLTLVKDTLAQPGTVAGAFELQIKGRARLLRLVEKMVNWRSRFCSLPYGDQAIFLAAEKFSTIGGFPEIPIMEDFVFVRRLRRIGKVAIARAAVSTSSRRWQKLGIFRTTIINQSIIIGYFFGVSPTILARWYGRK